MPRPPSFFVQAIIFYFDGSVIICLSGWPSVHIYMLSIWHLSPRVASFGFPCELAHLYNYAVNLFIFGMHPSKCYVIWVSQAHAICWLTHNLLTSTRFTHRSTVLWYTFSQLVTHDLPAHCTWLARLSHMTHPLVAPLHLVAPHNGRVPAQHSAPTTTWFPIYFT